MTGTVKASRRYVSPLRKQQAAATRHAAMGAARRLFERDGYAATSMAAVATEAAIAVKTLYLAFRSKPELLRAVWEHRLAGDEAGLPVQQRAWYREVTDTDDPMTKLHLLVQQSAGVKRRSGHLLVVIRDAASTDPEIQGLWDDIEAKLRVVSTTVVEQLAAAGALRPDVSPPAAADAVWALNHPSTWQLLVMRCGWSHEAYEQWLERSFAEQLLAP